MKYIRNIARTIGKLQDNKHIVKTGPMKKIDELNFE